MATSQEYFEQQAKITREYLGGRVSFKEAARSIATIWQTSFADEEAWPDEPSSARGHELRGTLHWFGPLVPDATPTDQAKLAALMDEVLAEWDRAEGITDS